MAAVLICPVKERFGQGSENPINGKQRIRWHRRTWHSCDGGEGALVCANQKAEIGRAHV